jgi:hypothetical protein
MEELSTQMLAVLGSQNRIAQIGVDNDDRGWRFVHGPLEGRIILGTERKCEPGDSYFFGNVTLPYHEGEVPLYFTVIKPATVAELTELAGQHLEPPRRFLYEVTND